MKLNESVNVTSSSVVGSSEIPQNAIQYDNLKNYFASKDTPNSWIKFDFNQLQIITKTYLIRSLPFGENSNHPKSWVIEGSNDDSTWETIDSQNNCPYLNGKLLIHAFDIGSNKPFRFIRMRSTGKDWTNSCDYLCMNSIEFFGILI